MNTNRKLTPSRIRSQIKELRMHLNCLENYVETQVRHHKKLDDGNATYDPVEYQCFQLMLHTSFIREMLNLHKSFEGVDGRGKRMLEFDDGSMFAAYGGRGYRE